MYNHKISFHFHVLARLFLSFLNINRSKPVIYWVSKGEVALFCTVRSDGPAAYEGLTKFEQRWGKTSKPWYSVFTNWKRMRASKLYEKEWARGLQKGKHSGFILLETQDDGDDNACITRNWEKSWTYWDDRDWGLHRSLGCSCKILTLLIDNLYHILRNNK